MSVSALRAEKTVLTRLRQSARFGARVAIPVGLAVVILIGANNALRPQSAEGDTRTLSFHHLHTDETITVTFKRNGRYDDAALKKLDWFMRDWRKRRITSRWTRICSTSSGRPIARSAARSRSK